MTPLFFCFPLSPSLLGPFPCSSRVGWGCSRCWTPLMKMMPAWVPSPRAGRCRVPMVSQLHRGAGVHSPPPSCSGCQIVSPILSHWHRGRWDPEGWDPAGDHAITHVLSKCSASPMARPWAKSCHPQAHGNAEGASFPSWMWAQEFGVAVAIFGLEQGCTPCNSSCWREPRQGMLPPPASPSWDALGAAAAAPSQPSPGA